MAVLARDGGAGGGTHMGEEQRRLDAARQREQVFVGPRRHDLAINARLGALAVPADAETVAMRVRLGLRGAQRLVEQRMRRAADQLVQEDGLTDIGDEAAHAATLSAVRRRQQGAKRTAILAA